MLDLPPRESGEAPAESGLECVDGIIAWVDRRHGWLPELAASGVPVVNCGGDWVEDKHIGVVAVELSSVLDRAISHFADLHLRHLAFFGHEVGGSPSRLALVKALDEKACFHGMTTSWVETRGSSPDEELGRLITTRGDEELLAQFKNLETPIGLFCENDYFGRLAGNVAREVGLRVPSDLAIIGSEDNAIGRFGNPTISTVRLPGIEVGERAFELIEAVIAGEPLPEEKIQIPATRLIVRESTGGSSLDIALERARRFIEHSPRSGLTVQELVPIAGLSVKALRRRYREAFGEGPSEHIRRLRLEECQRLLIETEMSLTSVAAECGFSSQAAFYNFFHRHAGVGPLEFRAGTASLSD